MGKSKCGLIGSTGNDLLASGTWDVAGVTLKFPDFTIHAPKRSAMPCTISIDRGRGCIDIYSVVSGDMPVIHKEEHHSVEVWLSYTLHLPIQAIRSYRVMHRGYHTGIEFSLLPGQSIKTQCTAYTKERTGNPKNEVNAELLAKLNYQFSIHDWQKGEQDALIQFLEETLNK